MANLMSVSKGRYGGRGGILSAKNISVIVAIAVTIILVQKPQSSAEGASGRSLIQIMPTHETADALISAGSDQPAVGEVTHMPVNTEPVVQPEAKPDRLPVVQPEAKPADAQAQAAVQPAATEAQQPEATTADTAASADMCKSLMSLNINSITQEYEHNGRKYTDTRFRIPRAHLPQILQSLGAQTGAELGILFADFARHHLSIWTKCKQYFAVDMWAHQQNYDDLANSPQKDQDDRYNTAMKKLEEFKDKVVVKRMKTVDAAKEIPNNSLDYVYVDARHDYCGAMEDMEAYWPKLKNCGILAGHDYHFANDAVRCLIPIALFVFLACTKEKKNTSVCLTPRCVVIYCFSQPVLATKQDWSLCMNGTKHPGAVKGAVRDFAAKNNLKIYMTDETDWPSWLVRKGIDN